MATDPVVAELVIGRASDAQIAAWGEMLAQLRQEQDIGRFCVLTTEFFYRLYRMSDNLILAMLFHSAMEPQQRMYEMFIEKNGTAFILQNAEEVFAYVRDRNAVAAAQCLKEAMMLPLSGETAII